MILCLGFANLQNMASKISSRRHMAIKSIESLQNPQKTLGKKKKKKKTCPQKSSKVLKTKSTSWLEADRFQKALEALEAQCKRPHPGRPSCRKDPNSLGDEHPTPLLCPSFFLWVVLFKGVFLGVLGCSYVFFRFSSVSFVV